METPTLFNLITGKKDQNNINNEYRYPLTDDNHENDDIDLFSNFTLTQNSISLRYSMQSREVENNSNKFEDNFSEFHVPDINGDLLTPFSDYETIRFFNDISDSDEDTPQMQESNISKRTKPNQVLSVSPDVFLSCKKSPDGDTSKKTTASASLSFSAPASVSASKPTYNSLETTTPNIPPNLTSELISISTLNANEEIFQLDPPANEITEEKNMDGSTVKKIIRKSLINCSFKSNKLPSDDPKELFLFLDGCFWGKEGCPSMIDLDVSHISAYYQNNQYSNCYRDYMKSMNLKRLELVDSYILLGITLPTYRILKDSFKITESVDNNSSTSGRVPQCFSTLHFKNIKLDNNSDKLTDIICDSIILIINANSTSEFEYLINFTQTYKYFFGKPFERNPNPEKKTFVDILTGKANKVEDKMSIGCMCKYLFFPRIIDSSKEFSDNQLKTIFSEYRRFATKLECLINEIQVIINIVFEILNVPTYELDGQQENRSEKVNITWKARSKELRFAIVIIVCKILSRFVALNLDDWYMVISRFCYYRAQSVKRVYQRCFASKMSGNDIFAGNEKACHNFAVKLANEFATRHFIDYQK